MNTDELISQMESDDLQDQIVEYGKMTPRDYGRLRNVAPQRIYYYLRTGRIEKETCPCGRRVIDVAAADRVLGFTKEEDE